MGTSQDILEHAEGISLPQSVNPFNMTTYNERAVQVVDGNLQAQSIFQKTA